MKNFEIKNVDCHTSLTVTKSVQSGRSMIEMLGVLAIIGVLSVGGIAGYSKAMMKYRINKTIEQITLIAGNIKAFFAPQRNYKGLTLSTDTGKAIIQKAKLVPDEMWNGYNLKHQFDGRVEIGSFPKARDSSCYTDKLCSSQAFYIQLKNFREEECIDLITQEWSNIGVDVMTISNAQNSVFTNTSISGATVVPNVSIDHAVKICKVPEADTDGIDYATFYFNVDITKGGFKADIDKTIIALRKE